MTEDNTSHESQLQEGSAACGSKENDGPQRTLSGQSDISSCAGGCPSVDAFESSVDRKGAGVQTTAPSEQAGGNCREEGEETTEEEIRDEALCVFLQRLVTTEKEDPGQKQTRTGVLGSSACTVEEKEGETKQQMRMTFEMLSDLAKDWGSHGLAWLTCFLFKKNEHLSIATLKGCLDLSGVWGVSSGQLFLFLDSLPFPVEEVKFDSVAVKEDARPLLGRFLKRSTLTKLAFSGGSIGRVEAPEVFSLIMPSLRALSLKGNGLGDKGGEALATEIRKGGASTLRSLELEGTGLKSWGLKSLCEAIKETGLGVEVLNLSQVRLRPFPRNEEGSRVEMLCSALNATSLPNVRVLVLKECGLRNSDLGLLASAVKNGGLLNLETLDLEGNDWGLVVEDLGGNEGRGSDGLVSLADAIRRQTVPKLKNLNLITRRGLHAQSVSVVLGMIDPADSSRPPFENVKFRIGKIWDADLTKIAAGRYRALRTLDFQQGGVYIFDQEPEWERGHQFITFTVISDQEPESRGGERFITALSESEDGIPFLKEFNLSRRGGGRGLGPLGRAMGLGKLPNLSVVNLSMSCLTDETVRELAEGVRGGGGVALTILNLSHNENVASCVWGELMNGIIESDRGFPKLRELILSRTDAEKAGGQLAAAFGSGKLPVLDWLVDDLDVRDGYAWLKLELDKVGVGMFAEAVRGGNFSPLRGERVPGIDRPPQRLFASLTRCCEKIDVSSILTAIAESETGLP
uniref:Uncharacterized protein n=1 Tax=Chromera velia CCMP2878 TaxID=1169474 RepID=A0A0G4HP89_9ALVE|eukprot:Cvel_7805.t1-p1 / transcript=Cvel_7805.t1 / gene=Cvel_7805 / organism=Chromera_velia_CCMP2878 / gene_product=hypothetical protein / transcript_product=hypothetical protein / location=Cvel_scaffold416:71606-78855(+) / protein_length=743 / sequence_SO=supercontig / SO=protein_coding / is_pseudo=false